MEPNNNPVFALGQRVQVKPTDPLQGHKGVTAGAPLYAGSLKQHALDGDVWVEFDSLPAQWCAESRLVVVQPK